MPFLGQKLRQGDVRVDDFRLAGADGNGLAVRAHRCRFVAQGFFRTPQPISGVEIPRARIAQSFELLFGFLQPLESDLRLGRADFGGRSLGIGLDAGLEPREGVGETPLAVQYFAHSRQSRPRLGLDVESFAESRFGLRHARTGHVHARRGGECLDELHRARAFARRPGQRDLLEDGGRRDFVVRRVPE